tara:strand:- start:359 stop:1603 length:1245 start_codon:yes stop_codon:yes gene_type:complete
MAISQNFPNTRPSLNLNFARSKTLDPRITFSRTSAGTYVDESGVIRTADADEPRFDHDHTTGESLGLLVEEQRTNVLEQSMVTTSNWTGGTSNTTYSNLSLNALGIFPGVEVTSTTGEAWHRRTTGYNVPFVSGTEYAVTFYYREGTSGYARLQFRYNSQESFVQGPADGSSWTLSQNIGSISNVTTTLMDGQSTYKTSYSFTPNFTGNADMGIGIGTGSAGTTVIALGGQVEAGAFPTSYIPTSGSQATRVNDILSIQGTNFTDVYNQTEGSYKVEGFIDGTLPSNTYGGIFGAGGGGSGTSNFIFFNPSNSFGHYVSNTSQTPDSTLGKTYTNGAKFKIAASYLEADFACSFNGDISNSSTSGALNGSMTYFRIGGNPISGLTGGIKGAMRISNISYYPNQITDTQLQTLTK